MSRHTHSAWCDHVRVPQFEALRGTESADVCVIGAGIAGLTSAYLLAKAGRSVIVLDERGVGAGMTSRTSAHLTNVIDDRFLEIERLHGEEASRICYASHGSAIDRVERIAREEKIDCEFARLDGFLSLHPSSPKDLLQREFDAAKRAGFSEIELRPSGGFGGGACIRFGNQGRFHPMKYLIGLTDPLVRMGVKIYTGQRVIDAQGVDRKNNVPAFAQLKNGARVNANHIVVATNTPAPINDWMGIYLKQSAYQTYLIGAKIPRGAVDDALRWDTGDPYHYVRLEHGNAAQADSDILLVGGEDHKTGQFPPKGAPFLQLETWAREMFPAIQEIVYRWSGEIQESDDGVAFIGRAPTKLEEVFVITGDSGMGLTHGTLGAILVTDLIMGRSNDWAKLYDPTRKSVRGTFVSENVNAVKQYADLLTPGEVSSVDEIRAGQGAVVRSGLTKLAVFRDENGSLHQRSAICTHLKCVVQWNPVEKTWDCPCHGSRFDATGEVIMGPAIDDLPTSESK